MPALRPAASCIWHIFRSSGKKHLFLTGSRKSGKTTLLHELCPEMLPGITTWAEPGKAVYLQENRTGLVAQVGRFDPAIPTAENRMRPTAGFDALGVDALRRCMDAPAGICTIDEIGYLESCSPAYQTAFHTLLTKKQVIAVVRKQELPFLQTLLHREDAFVVDLDAPYGSAGCVIMASGLGKRFGGNKLMADFHGSPLICRALDATESIFTRRIVVTRHDDVAELCRIRGIDVIRHNLPYRSDTVRLGLSAMEVDHCMFLPGDQPLLRRETTAALTFAAAHIPDVIWRTACNGIPGSPVIFPAWAYPELLNLPEGKGGGAVIKRHPQQVRLLPVADPLELADTDSPEELEQLKRVCRTE